MELEVAIGDVHGEYDKLLDLIMQIPSNSQLIFLGDYVDRGPDSALVVDLIRELTQDGHIALMGNHEQMLIDAYDNVEYAQHWIENGGMETLISFKGWTDIPIDWFRSLPHVHETNNRLFVHAGFDPKVELQDQNADTCMWIREDWLNHSQCFHGKYVVHGHTPIHAGKLNSHKVEIRKWRTNLDTGACHGGRLSAAIFDPNIPGRPLEIIQT